jgi:hypothetical protein
LAQPTKISKEYRENIQGRLRAWDRSPNQDQGVFAPAIFAAKNSWDDTTLIEVLNTGKSQLVNSILFLVSFKRRVIFFFV